MKTFDEIKRLPEFEKDLKKLLKRFRTLEEDLDICIKSQVTLYHKENIDNKGIFPISDLGIQNPKIYKVTKFACMALKGRGAKSGIRLTYAYFEKEDRIELIEMYFKSDKENENRERIKMYYLQAKS